MTEAQANALTSTYVDYDYFMEDEILIVYKMSNLITKPWYYVLPDGTTELYA